MAGARFLPLGEDIREQIAERRRCVSLVPGKIEPLELEGDRVRSVCHRARRVVAPAKLRIGQSLIRPRDLTEPGFRRVIAGIDIRMIFARQPPVRALDLD